MEKLTGDVRRAALAGLPGWNEVAGRDAIAKTFVFADFNEAIRIAGSGNVNYQAAPYAVRGHHYYRMDDLHRALADYEQSLRVQSEENWQALYGRGLVKLRRGDKIGRAHV